MELGFRLLQKDNTQVNRRPYHINYRKKQQHTNKYMKKIHKLKHEPDSSLIPSLLPLWSKASAGDQVLPLKTTVVISLMAYPENHNFDLMSLLTFCGYVFVCDLR